MIPNTKPTTARVSAVSETFVVPTSTSQEDVLKALSELDRRVDRKTRGISVRVSGKQFIIARKQRLINPFARAIFGVVNEASRGSIVDYTFSVKPAVRILFSMWFALITVVLITGISAIMTSGVSEFRLELVVLSVAFLGGALGIVSLCLLLSRNGEKEIERTLLAIIGDTVQSE